MTLFSRWPSLQDLVGGVVNGISLYGACVMYLYAAARTETDLKGLAWPLVIGALSTGFVSLRGLGRLWNKIRPEVGARALAGGDIDDVAAAGVRGGGDQVGVAADVAELRGLALGEPQAALLSRIGDVEPHGFERLVHAT